MRTSVGFVHFLISSEGGRGVRACAKQKPSKLVLMPDLVSLHPNAIEEEEKELGEAVINR